jgi:hypothetical protein
MRGQVDAVGVFPAEALAYIARTQLVTAGLRPIVRIRAADAEAVVSNPRQAIRRRTAAFASSTVRAAGVLRETYGAESREAHREWGRDES